MDDRGLIERRRGVLETEIEALREDIVQSEEHIQMNELELIELDQVEQTLNRLRGARPAKPKPRITSAKKNTKKPKASSSKKRSVASLIEEVLFREGRAMRPVEINRFVQDIVEYKMHDKHVGKECCRLFDQGRLLKDELTKQYSLPPNWDDNRNPKSSLSSQLSNPAKGREAVPGGAS